MALTMVSGVWVRQVPPNNFFNIERHSSAGPESGGGALYIEAPSSTVPALLELLGRDPAAVLDDEFAVDTRVIGAPATSAPLVWNSKTGNRMRLFQNRQSGSDVRHPAWRANRGFPTAPDSVASTEEAAEYIADGLRVYVVRTDDGEYYAGFLEDGYPPDWPDNADLRTLFTGRGGVKQFTGGLYLEPVDQAAPFRTDADDTVFAHGGVIETGEDPEAWLPSAVVGGTTAYASPETAAAVDRIAMDLALEYAQARFPDAHVRRMPHNNPGYDILISDGKQPVRYIEVKGTTFANPRFFLSENERRFSEDNAELYTLVVFYDLDLEAETAERVDRDGGISEADLGLKVAQWRGTISL
jgi:Domain of unknown function (DUF3883)